MAKQDDYARYTVRIPASTYKAIEASAAARNRSVNAEIIERLEYTVEYPPQEFAKVKSEAVRLGFDALSHQREIDELNERFEQVVKASKQLKVAADQGFDYQRRLMYFVLNYLDEIPRELAIWAFDIIASIERTEMLRAGAEEPALSDDQLRELISTRRENYKREAMDAIREMMAEVAGESLPANKDVPPRS